MLAEIDARVAGFEAQAEGLLSEYTAAGEAERDRIIAEATSEAQRIKAEAKRVAENEASRAKEKLEAEIVNEAVKAAESMIRSQLTSDDHHRLVPITPDSSKQTGRRKVHGGQNDAWFYHW